MKKQKYIQKILMGTVAGALALQLAACGMTAQPVGNAGGETDGNPSQESGENPGNTESSPAQQGADAKISTDNLVGDWVMVYTSYHSEYEEDESYDSVTMCDAYYSPQSEMLIRKEGDKLVADYRYIYEMGSDRFYGNELVYHGEAAYQDCENSEWYYTFSMPYEDDEELLITLTDPDTLIRYDEYETDPEELGEDYYFYRSQTKSVYLRKDSPRLENPEDLRYFNTVTVSNAKDLVDSIANNTKIILEAGTYDLSKVDFEKADNRYLCQEEYGDYYFSASNVCLEAKDGADVLICVADPYEPVLSFQYDENVTLRGLTVGHDVEPGYCSGSVVKFVGVSGVNVDKCKLYGSGTYGVEASGCYGMTVQDSDIYECTYGLVDLRNVSSVLFKNCDMRDSGDMSMFELSGSYGVEFEDCKIHDNVSATDYDCPFICLGDEYVTVTFRNCEFSNNRYKTFSDYSVTLDKCSVNDIVK